MHEALHLREVFSLLDAAGRRDVVTAAEQALDRQLALSSSKVTHEAQTDHRPLQLRSRSVTGAHHRNA